MSCYERHPRSKIKNSLSSTVHVEVAGRSQVADIIPDGQWRAGVLELELAVPTAAQREAEGCHSPPEPRRDHERPKEAGMQYRKSFNS